MQTMLFHHFSPSIRTHFKSTCQHTSISNQKFQNFYNNNNHSVPRNKNIPWGTWEILIPVDESASWLTLDICTTSPKAVIVTGPLIPLALMAAVIVWATLKTFTPAGTLQFSKSHHTETLTFLDSSSCRLGEVLEEVEKWATKILKGDEGEDEEE